ncbi:MAG: GNAT family N-acetyltransferase [Syntrophomonadaceae bacterium]|nr:GNAT family N-acetyltransferase [Syntrophomonadaceae bacterium]
MEVRFANIFDLPGIVDIYNQGIATKATADTKPFAVDDKLEWFYQHPKEMYPIYVMEHSNQIVGWCSISPYRPGRMAVRQTAEISYYVDQNYHRLGIGTSLVNFTIDDCPRLGISNLLAVILEWNVKSVQLVQKFGFEQWGYLPQVANFDGKECSQYIFGKKI